MGITQLTPASESDTYIDKWIERKTKAIINILQYVGERCLTAARESGSYTDRTGNLRSSIGYAIVIDGKIFDKSNFKIVKNGNDGAEDGIRFLRKIAGQFTDGIALIVVAGMNYAAYVSARGYDVIDSAELLADKLVPQLLKQLGFN